MSYAGHRTIIDADPEGTSDPIGRFEATLTGCDATAVEAFYHGNMRQLMGPGA